MKDTLPLEDITLFLAVADAGGLQGAVAATGVSAPTLSRKMAALERRLGRHLFIRGARGYGLTADGRALLDEAAILRRAAAQMDRFATAESAPRVRITAGTFTARYLARRMHEVWSPDAPWVPEFLSANAVLDIARRAADIGLRARRPEQTWLAGQMVGRAQYAIYGRDRQVTGFVALSEDQPSTPAERWLRAHHAAEIVTEVNTERLALDLACAGMGKIVLPIFAGSDDSGLIPLSDPIADLTHEQWLVSHHDARHDPPVRRAIDAIAQLMRAQRHCL